MRKPYHSNKKTGRCCDRTDLITFLDNLASWPRSRKIVKCGLDKFSRIFLGKTNGSHIPEKNFRNGIDYEKFFCCMNRQRGVKKC
jgi:hypothetical protein